MSADLNMQEYYVKPDGTILQSQRNGKYRSLSGTVYHCSYKHSKINDYLINIILNDVFNYKPINYYFNKGYYYNNVDAHLTLYALRKKDYRNISSQNLRASITLIGTSFCITAPECDKSIYGPIKNVSNRKRYLDISEYSKEKLIALIEESMT